MTVCYGCFLFFFGQSLDYPVKCGEVLVVGLLHFLFAGIYQVLGLSDSKEHIVADLVFVHAELLRKLRALYVEEVVLDNQ